MKLKNINEADGKITFDVSDTNVFFLNAIRRSIMQNVLTWAPEKITIRKNTTCYNDEYVANRIGLIPFDCIDTTDIDATDINTKIVLQVKGRDARASDISNKSFKASFDMLFLNILEDQEIDMDVSMIQGSGSAHPRWDHATSVAYDELASDKFTFCCESISNRKPRDLIRQACDYLIDKVNRIDVDSAQVS